MAIVFDATIGGDSANSYSEIADYNQYRENVGLVVRTDEEAKVDLIKATEFIDSQYREKWNTSSKVDSDQALHWPQSGATLYDGTAIPETVIPEQVKKACYEYAIRVIANSQTYLDPGASSNTKKQKLEGVGEIEYFSRTAQGQLPDDFAFINKILSGLIRNASGLSCFDLYRSN